MLGTRPETLKHSIRAGMASAWSALHSSLQLPPITAKQQTENKVDPFLLYAIKVLLLFKAMARCIAQTRNVHFVLDVTGCSFYQELGMVLSAQPTSMLKSI